MNKKTEILIKFLKEKSNNGQKTITVPLKRKRKNFDSFEIQLIYKNYKIIGINVERRVLPADTVFPIEIFDLILKLLSKANNLTMPNGNAQKFKMGESALHDKTIEYAVAKEIYGKMDGDSTHRRISVISNILIAAKLCESRPSSLKLNSK